MDNWITKQFTFEYAALFMVWLPFLARYNLPFPLGGTSNHIRRTALDSVDGWDAYNVTEDADLSFRLAANGWNLGYITPPTYEEAVKTPISWAKQRSRWMKGYFQTYCVHMQKPWSPDGKRAAKRLIILHLTVGVTLLAGLLHIPSLALVVYTVFAGPPGEAISSLIGISLSFTYIAGMLLGAIGAARAGFPKLILSTLWMPIYWLALFPPTLMALYELKYKPFFWNKTEHGDRDAAISNPSTVQDENAPRL